MSLNSHSFRAVCVLTLLATAVTVQSVRAQVLYGSIIGVAEDPSGGTVPNAKITATNKGTGQVFDSKSDEAGRYSFVNLLPGTYDLKLTATGFKTATRTEIAVTANTVTRMDVKLEIGQLTEQITVQAEATSIQTAKSNL